MQNADTVMQYAKKRILLGDFRVDNLTKSEADPAT